MAAVWKDGEDAGRGGTRVSGRDAPATRRLGTCFVDAIGVPCPTVRRLLYLTLPACLLTGWAAVRAVRETGQRVNQDVSATFRVDSMNLVMLPQAGVYRAVGIGSREAIKAVDGWAVSVRNRETGAEGQVQRATSERAQSRENRPGLDLLFTMRIDQPGTWELRFGNRAPQADSVTIRLTHFDTTTAGSAMKAFGLATLFSVLLLVSAALWFRR